MKINIGCGTNIVLNSDWVNCDNSVVARLRKSIFWKLINIPIYMGLLDAKYRSYPKVNILNIKNILPYTNESVKYIYSSQVIEHLYYYDVLKFLKECHRVLKVGGRIRILTPSLEKIINLYSNSDIKILKQNTHLNSLELSDHLNLFFYPRINISKNKIGFFESLMEKIPEQHKYIYDISSLTKLATAAGFNKIYELETNESQFPDVILLDGYQEVSLMIELEK